MKKTKTKPSQHQGRAQADICIVGGAGHVGLPLGLVLADKGMHVLLYDLSEQALATIGQGRMPFMEHGAGPLLKKALKQKRLSLSSTPEAMAGVKTVIITIGTPVDEFMNPDMKVIKHCVDDLLPYLKDGQLILLRSTVYPGTTDWLAKYLRLKGKKVKVSFCPERVVQGYAIQEVQKMPQIISGVTPGAEKEARRLFKRVTSQVVSMKPMEAEFAKLFSNAYRYIQFSIANQFYMIAKTANLDYNRIVDGMKKDYKRAREIPRAGFAAGPCLLKDTMQLAAFSDNHFSLGHTAMIINEGLVLNLVDELETKYKLDKMTVGLLGMAFKADSDDTRSSLSYKLKKALMYHAKEVLTTDPHVVSDPNLLPLNKVIEESDVLVLCVPHQKYKNINLKKKPVLDIWGFFN